MIRRLGRTYRDAFTGLPHAVWILSFVAFVNRSGTMVLPFLSLYLTRELGLSTLETGFILACYGGGSIVGTAAGGWLSDRVGAVRVQLASLVATGFGFLALARVQDPRALAAAVFAVSAIADAFRPAVMAATTEHAPAGVRTRALALLRLAVNLGMAIGPALGGFLATRNYAWLFVGDAATCWLAGVVLALSMRGLAPAEEDPSATAERAARSPWTDPPFLAFLGLMLALTIVFFQVFTTLPLYFRDVYGLPEAAIGALFGLNAASIVVVEMPLVRALERRDTLRIVSVGALFVCAGFALMPFGRSAPWAALTVLVWTVGEMLWLPFSNGIVAHRAGPGSRGRYMGAYGTTFSIAFVVAPLAGTAVYAGLGARALWLGIGAVGIVVSAGFGVLARTLWRVRG